MRLVFPRKLLKQFTRQRATFALLALSSLTETKPPAGCLPHLVFLRRCKQHKANATSPRRLETLWAARFPARFEVAKMILHKVLCFRICAARQGGEQLACKRRSASKQPLACGSLTFVIILPLAKLEPRGSARAGGSGSQDS